MIIRPMTIADCAKVELIEKSTFSEPWSYEVFLGCLMQENYHMIVACDDEDTSDILGYFCFYTVLDEGDISNVCVRADKRRQGIADALMDYLLDTAKKLELSVLFLEVRESNYPAQALYEKKGFVRNGLRKNFYTLPTENAVLMQCEIKNDK